jgi:hypothetical protein
MIGGNTNGQVRESGRGAEGELGYKESGKGSSETILMIMRGEHWRTGFGRRKARILVGVVGGKFEGERSGEFRLGPFGVQKAHENWGRIGWVRISTHTV